VRAGKQIGMGSSLSKVFSGSPGTYLENIDISDEEILKKIVNLQKDEMEEYGLSIEQQNEVLDILKLLEEKREKMDSLQREVESIESRMRAINLTPFHVEGRPLSDIEKRLLTDYEKQIEIKRQRLAELRDYYQIALIRHDLILHRRNAMMT